MTTESTKPCFTIYDPHAETLHCKNSFNEAAEIADSLGCSIITAVSSDNLLGTPLCRYRKSADDKKWHIESPKP